MYIAYGKVHGLVTILCTDSTLPVWNDESVLRERALEVIYELGADDSYKDALRGTLTIVPLEVFAHDPSELIGE